jgi:hypothetical protein
MESRLTDILDNLQWNLAIEHCEAHELKILGADVSRDIPSFYAAFLFCYLLNGDHVNVSFLHKRIEDAIKQDADVAGAWEVARHMRERRFSEAHGLLNSHNWSAQMKFLAVALKGTLQADCLRLFNAAYSNIAVAELAKVLGCSPEEAVALAQSHDLVQDVQDGFVTWKRTKTAQGVAHQGGGKGLDTLKRLAEYSMFIES